MMRIVWNYKGHNPKLWTRGGNWWQVSICVFGRWVAIIWTSIKEPKP